MDSRSGFGFAWNLEHFQNERLCHGTVLTALRGAYRFTPAQAAIFIAAKTARVPHGPKATCVHGRLAKAPLRETLLPLLAPSMPHDHAARVVAPGSLRSRFRRSTLFSTRFCDRAFQISLSLRRLSVFSAEIPRQPGKRPDIFSRRCSGSFPVLAPAVGNKDCCFPKCRPVRLW